MLEEKNPNTDESAITAIETEESGAYDPFKAAKEMDDEFIAERDGLLKKEQEQKQEQAKDEPAPTPDPAPEDKPKDDPNPPAEDKPAIEEGKHYTPQELARIEELARKGLEYEKYFNSKEGKEFVGRIYDGDKKAAKEAEDKKKSRAERWRKVNEDMYGDYASEYLDSFNETVDQMVEEKLSKRLEGVLKETEFVKNDRIGRAQKEIEDRFGNHIQDVYNIPPEDAHQIAKFAMEELKLKIPDFDPQVYELELAVFADKELAEINKAMLAKQRDEFEALKAKVAKYESEAAQRATAPAATPPSSTAIAAERVLGERDANYKRDGGIPTGRAGGGQSGEDESEAAIAFFHPERA